MKLKNKVAMLLAVSMMASLGSVATVNAEEIDEEFPILTEDSDFENVPEIGSLDQYKGSSFDDVIMDNSGIALAAATGDSYEANNGPNVATSGRYNKVTYGSIHDASDVDWYTIEVLDDTKPISVFLTNIPNGCDYDMYLLQYDPQVGITTMYYNIKSGNESEELAGTVEEIGTYYVVIQASSSIPDNNFSSSNYALYMGDYYMVGQHGYVDTGLDISFGNIAVGNTTPVYKQWYTYDLRNDASIPDDAIVTKIYLTGNGNGAYWLGFYKMLAAGDQGIQLEQKLGQVDLMYSGDNRLIAKQRWLIGGNILASKGFVWEPKILIAYKYEASISNLRFLPN